MSCDPLVLVFCVLDKANPSSPRGSRKDKCPKAQNLFFYALNTQTHENPRWTHLGPVGFLASVSVPSYTYITFPFVLLFKHVLLSVPMEQLFTALKEINKMEFVKPK